MSEDAKSLGFEKALRSILAPDPEGDIIEWLEKNVKNIPYSPMPGPFRIESTPYLAEILRSLTDPEVEYVVVMAPVQSGKSMVLELWSAFVPARQPGPMLMLQDVDMNAQDWQKTRLRPLWDNTPSTRSKISQSERSTWHTTQFERNTTWVLGAENIRNLQRRSIRFLGCDEVWQYKKGHAKEALARLTAFKWQSKAAFVSQGGLEDDDITDLYNGTDRGRLTFECVKCNFRQPWDWAQIVLPQEAKEPDGWNLDKVRSNTQYKCKNCDHHYKDRNAVRQELNKSLKYLPQNPSAPKGRRGFNYPALCVSWGLSWGDLAVEWIDAKEELDDTGDTTKMREFTQKRLALPWSEAPDDNSVEIESSSYIMADIWPDEAAMFEGKITEPPFTDDMMKSKTFARLRFMSVDVQRKGFYCVTRAWSAFGHSRLVNWTYVENWNDVRAEQIRQGVADLFVFVDSGDGPNTDEVYRMCANFNWNATKGSGSDNFPWRVNTPYGVKAAFRPYARAKVIQVGSKSCRLYLFSNLVLKDTLARLRKRGHHTYASDAGDEYKKQMMSELRTRTDKGKPIWVQIGDKANHLWDCEVMNILPALMAKLVGRGKNKNSVEKEASEQEAIDKKAEDV